METNKTGITLKDEEIKYLPSDNVWVMCGDKPRMSTVYSSTITRQWGGMGGLVLSYSIWHSKSLFGARCNNCETYQSKEVYSTKDDLLNSL